MDALCNEILSRLDQGLPLVLVTIMDQHGSAPRTAGARMLVAPDGGIAGTVGGGRYEAEAIAAALEMHAAGRGLAPGEPAPAALMHYSLKGVKDMDMICGGALTLLLEYISDTPRMRAIFAAGSEAENSRRPFALLARLDMPADSAPLPDGAKQPLAVERFLWLPERKSLLPEAESLAGAAAGPAPEFLARLAKCKGSEPRLMEDGGTRYLLEPFQRPFRILLFGGGHVSLETAALALHMGFQVTVAEDRPEFASPERFPGCATEPLPSLGERDCAGLLGRFSPGPCDAVVIITRGHSHDRDALAAALPTGAGYIGMIGSKVKRAAVYEALRRTGVSKEALAAVKSPIGLAIGAETPAEIGVSIVGELIAWRKAVRDAGAV